MTDTPRAERPHWAADLNGLLHEAATEIDRLQAKLAATEVNAAGWVCSHDGYSPTNRGSWCDLGCGSDYNRMIPVSSALIPFLTSSRTEREAQAKLAEAIPLSVVSGELDNLIRFWRDRKSSAEDEEGRLIAMCYVDAFQSARNNLVGETLPPEQSDAKGGKT